MKKISIKELTKIGEKIDRAIKAVKEVELKKEELEKFENYIIEQETISPLVNPMKYRKLFTMLDKAKVRINLLRPIIQLKD